MPHILLIEDNEFDAMLALETFAPYCDWPVCHLHTAEDALRYLQQQTPYQDSPEPDLLLLDLNLPGMNGDRFLALIRDQLTLKDLKVFALLGSASEEAWWNERGLQADAFIAKPVQAEQVISVLQKLG